MANILKISTLVQNTWPGTETKKAIKHRVPDLNLSISGEKSIVASFTGTSNKEIAIAISGGTVINVDGVTQKDPITGATLVPTKIKGFCVTAERATVGTATTGTAAIQIQDFGAANTDNDFELTEGGILLFRKNAGTTISGAGSLYVKLSGTTGYRANVIVWFEE